MCPLWRPQFRLPLPQSWLGTPLLPDWKLQSAGPALVRGTEGDDFGDLLSWVTLQVGTLYFGARSSTPFLIPRRCTSLTAGPT